MFFEEITLTASDTLPALARAYGYKTEEWVKIWEDSINADLVAERKTHDKVQAGDRLYVPIPWRVVSRTLNNMGDGAEMIVLRDGQRGTRLHYAQTVNQSNQPVGATNQFCVDGCPADDDLPFYWTVTELNADPGRRRRFYDHSSRSAPSVAQGTTRWRAILSIAVVTRRRVTVYDSLVWGWDMAPSGTVTLAGPRWANHLEIRGHLELLRTGVGTDPRNFSQLGWTFRTPPIDPRAGDYPMPNPNLVMA